VHCPGLDAPTIGGLLINQLASKTSEKVNNPLNEGSSNKVSILFLGEEFGKSITENTFRGTGILVSLQEFPKGLFA